ncbi:MAG: transposase [Cyanobacteria bacterium]|nr:transposase [Cyanobacteriota bacterium]
MANTPPRFPGFDYAGFNRYFITICVDKRSPVFLDIELGRYIVAQLLIFAEQFGFEVIAYCVMPDHIHVLLAGQRDDSFLLPFLKRYKQATGYNWKHERNHRSRLWQEGYYDRILRDHDPTEGVIRYILENPVRAGIIEDAREYALIGAANYDIDDLLLSAMLWRPDWKSTRPRRD